MQNDEGQNMDLYIPRKWYVMKYSFLGFSFFFLSLGPLLLEMVIVIGILLPIAVLPQIG